MGQTDQVVQLLHEIQTISASYKRVAEATGENFNIFSILQMESDEVATHSRFIAELLDPRGSHGQKDKFLKNFKDIFAPESNLKTATSKVMVEYYIGRVQMENGGRIDILIKDKEGDVIMVENKVYAPEQPNQLLRYHNAFPQGTLIYLTLFGEESRQESAQNLYRSFSYETDMITWLERCKKDALNVPIISEAITQYINLIKKLTHQNLNKQMNKDIISRILKDKGSLTAYKSLYDVNKDLKQTIVEQILKEMVDILNDRGYINIETMGFREAKGQLVAFQTEDLKNCNLKFALSFEWPDYAKLILGFKNTAPDHPLNSKLFELLSKEFPRAQQSNEWGAYIVYEGYRDWYYNTLNEIYFDQEKTFYKDFENKLDTMMGLFKEATKANDNHI
ncbi:MAG: PD-(D/E)XK nuclease family protein [Flavobacteriaceae bacterium]|nr:PD-(D/E)XK nuclease family protein [Flavobacteriaceae bacterium]